MIDTLQARCGGTLVVCVALLSLSACASRAPLEKPAVNTKAWSDEAQNRRELLVGKWLSESINESGDLRLSLIERNINGTYRTVFRAYTSHAYEESVEVGLWGLSERTYFTIMRGWIIDGDFIPSDPTRTYYYDAYRVSNLDMTTFEYESLESGNRHSNRRVGEDFRFSD